MRERMIEKWMSGCEWMNVKIELSNGCVCGWMNVKTELINNGCVCEWMNVEIELKL